jgi:hypothetical protein
VQHLPPLVTFRENIPGLFEGVPESLGVVAGFPDGGDLLLALGERHVVRGRQRRFGGVCAPRGFKRAGFLLFPGFLDSGELVEWNAGH